VSFILEHREPERFKGMQKEKVFDQIKTTRRSYG